MALFHIPLNEITDADLRRLVASRARESEVVDYKLAWQMVSDSDRKEFAADASSFANKEGGDLVYGVREKDGAPVEVVGLDGFAQDKEQLRAEQVLASGVDPRLSGVAFHSVALASGRVVFIVRIPRATHGAHMVTAGGAFRFYTRHSAGKVLMSREQIANAMQQGASRSDLLLEFRNERIERVAAGDVGVTLWGRTAVVLHVLPVNEPPDLDLTKVFNVAKPLRPMGLHLTSYGHHMTADGLMVSSSLPDHTTLSYALLSRNGCVEAVFPDPTMEQYKRINPDYEPTVRRGLMSYFEVLPILGVAPPYQVGLGLVHVGGFTMHVPTPLFPPRHPPVTVRTSHLILPLTTVDGDTASMDAALRASFDRVWQACGHFRSPNFDEQGKWRQETGEL